MSDDIDKGSAAMLCSLPAGFVDVRIIGKADCWPAKKQERIARYVSQAVPRVGDSVRVQHISCPVGSVVWEFVNGRPCVDVFVDVTEWAEDMVGHGEVGRH